MPALFVFGGWLARLLEWEARSFSSFRTFMRNDSLPPMLTGWPLLLAIAASILLLILLSTRWRLHPFLAILLSALALGLGVGLPPEEVVGALTAGFGQLLAYIGLIVVLGSMIGVILEESGAALTIARLVLRWIGEGRSGLALLLIGATVSVPVFCDSGFIILAGLRRSLAHRAGTSGVTLTLCLAAGLYTTHTLIPPTPGPVAAAGNLGVAEDLGVLILMGFLLSLPALILGYLFARWRGRGLATTVETALTEKPKGLPALGASILPVVLPLGLIAVASLLGFWEEPPAVIRWLRLLGHPVMALLIGLFAALWLLPTPKGTSRGRWLGRGIELAGPILILTGVGGAFGGVLAATPLRALVASWTTGAQLSGAGLLIGAFGLSALLKSAQGSSTNAMVITSSLLATLAPELGFDTPSEMALVVAAIGGGAMTVSHANDSFFWVVSQFGDLPMPLALRTYTPLTAVLGVTVLVSTLLTYAALNFLT